MRPQHAAQEAAAHMAARGLRCRQGTGKQQHRVTVPNAHTDGDRRHVKRLVHEAFQGLTSPPKFVVDRVGTYLVVTFVTEEEVEEGKREEQYARSCMESALVVHDPEEELGDDA